MPAACAATRQRSGPALTVGHFTFPCMVHKVTQLGCHKGNQGVGGNKGLKRQRAVVTAAQ